MSYDLGDSLLHAISIWGGGVGIDIEEKTVSLDQVGWLLPSYCIVFTGKRTCWSLPMLCIIV